MMKRFLASGVCFLALLAALGPAMAGQLPLVSGATAAACAEGSQGVACANAIINQANTSFGWAGSQVGPTPSIATTNEQILSQAIIPGGSLNNAGQSMRLRCGGTTAADTNSKTVRLYWGQAVVVSPAITTSGAQWELELLVTAASATANQVVIGRGSFGNGVGSFAAIVTPVVTQDTFDNLSANITAKCTTTQGSSIQGDVTLENFLLEYVR